MEADVGVEVEEGADSADSQNASEVILTRVQTDLVQNVLFSSVFVIQSLLTSIRLLLVFRSDLIVPSEGRFSLLNRAAKKLHLFSGT